MLRIPAVITESRNKNELVFRSGMKKKFILSDEEMNPLLTFCIKISIRCECFEIEIKFMICEK